MGEKVEKAKRGIATVVTAAGEMAVDAARAKAGLPPADSGDSVPFHEIKPGDVFRPDPPASE